MALVRLALRRLIAQRYLTLCMVVATAFSVGALISGPIYADGASRAIVAGYLEQASAVDKNVTIDTLTGYGFDPAATTSALRGALGSLPVARIVLEEQEPSTVVRGPGGSRLGAVAFRDGIFSSVTLQEGREPQTPDEVAVPSSQAFALGVRPGSTLTLRYAKATTVRVSGVYLPNLSTDPSLYAQGALFGGSEGLPLLTTAEGFTSIAGALGQKAGLSARWDVELDLRSPSVAELERLAGAEDAVAGRIRTLPGMSHATVTGRLQTLIPEARHLVTQGIGPIYLVVLIIAALGLVVLVGIGSLMLARRSFELSVFKSRGARTRYLLSTQAIEGAVAAILGFALALGIGVALALLARDAHGPGLPGVQFRIGLNRAAIIVGVAGAAVAAASLVLVSIPYLRRTVVEERRLASREERPVWGRYPIELVFLLVGGIAYYELQRRGVQTSSGTLDPIVLVAPMVLLLGVALFTIRAFAWVFRRADVLVARFGSVRAYLAGHRLSRTTAASQAIALLLLLALSLFVFASSLRTTVMTSNRRASLDQDGADWNALVQTQDQILPLMRALPARTTLVFFGSTTVTGVSGYPVTNLVAVDPSTYAAGASPPSSGAPPIESWLGRISPSSSSATGVALPSDTSRLDVAARIPDLPGAALTAVVEDAEGRISDLELDPAESGTYSTPTPGATRLLSIVLTVPFFPARAEDARSKPFTGTFSGITAITGGSSAAIPLDGWQPLLTTGETTPPSTGPLRVTIQPFEGQTVTAIAPPAPPIAAVLAGPRVGSQNGPIADTLTIQAGELHTSIHVVARIPALPGAPPDLPSLIVDERTLVERYAQLLAPPEAGGLSVLAMGTDDPSPALRRAGLFVVVTKSARELEAEFASSPQSLALGIEFAAAVAAAILAVAGLGLAFALGERRREYEFATLNAIGVGPPDVVAALAAEQLVVLGFTIAAAIALGQGLLRLVSSSIAPTLPSPTGLLLDWAGIGATIVATIATAVLGFVVSVRNMRARSSWAVLRGEIE